MIGEPTMILVEPQMGENIGAAARAMWNFGLRNMRLVSPRDGWPNPSATAMASGAGGLLDEAQSYATTAEAAGDLHYVYATTARPRELTKEVLTPAEAAADAARRIAAGEKVGVFFGKERSGLSAEDVVLANAIVSVPVNPDFPSLNLAQCVLLVSYEWRKATEGDHAPGRKHIPLAPQEDVGRMIDHLVAELDEAGFFFPEAKAKSMQANLANLFRRAPLTQTDVRTLRGVIRALASKRRSS